MGNNPDAYEREERYPSQKTQALAELYAEALGLLGEDVQREGLQKTPERMAKAMQFLTQGYQQDPAGILREALFQEDHNEMVLVRDIEVFSMCEHHILPFLGKAHIAYIPQGTICGLSKIPRVVDAFSRRLQVQERLTSQIRDCLQHALNPQGVAVVIEARHLCMQMRGVEKQQAITTTSSFTGVFEQAATRQEFFQLISSARR